MSTTITYSNKTISIRSNGGILRSLFSKITIHNRTTGQSLTVDGVWDTGCGTTSFNEEDLISISAPVGGPIVSVTANGSVPCNTFTIDLDLMPDETRTMKVVGIPGLASGLCLIGMDIIGSGDFSITNYGFNTIMSFRVPSKHEIDYGVNPDYISEMMTAPKKPLPSRAASIKVGRNDPCPCGSGKKFKACHGKDS